MDLQPMVPDSLLHLLHHTWRVIDKDADAVLGDAVIDDRAYHTGDTDLFAELVLFQILARQFGDGGVGEMDDEK